MPLLPWLEYMDKVLFILINNDSQHSFWDPIMLGLRNPVTWIPLYLFMVLYIFIKTRDRTWLFIIFSLVTFGVANTLSSEILKPLFARERPCFDPEIHPFLRSVIDCGGIYSLPSTHAVNHFAIASFWYWAIYLLRRKKWRWLWVWAACISYAQVYVGKHYPSDVILGAIIGYLIGILTAKIFENILKRDGSFAINLHWKNMKRLSTE